MNKSFNHAGNAKARLRPGLLFFVLCAAALGVLTMLAPMFGTDGSRLPGDLGDCRFVGFSLEHGYRFLRGLDPSFWDAAIYYPMTNTQALSDNMVGGLPLYALLRLGADDPLAAMGLWIGLTCLLNYGVAVWCYARMGAHPAAAAVGAFACAFGLVVAANAGHPQSLQLYPLALALLGLWGYLDRPTPRSLAWLAASCCFLALASFYFWAFFLMTACLALLLTLLRGQITLADIVSSLRPNRLAWPVLALCLAVLAANYWPHYQVSKLTGPWNEDISQGLVPRAASFLFPAKDSLAWSWLEPAGQGLPYAGEHRLFLGLSLLAGAAWGLWHFARSRDRRTLITCSIMMGAVVMALVCLDVNGHSLVRSLRAWPGFSSLRSVTRLVFVLSTVFGLGLSLALSGLLARLPRGLAALTALCALGLVAADQHVSSQGFPSFDRADAAARVTALAARIPADCRVFLALPKAKNETLEAVYEHIDAMLAAQQLGKATYNGYTGWLPPVLGAFYHEPSCEGFDDWRNVAQRIFRPETNWQELYAGSALLNFGPCTPDPAVFDRPQGVNRAALPALRQAVAQGEFTYDATQSKLAVRATVRNQSQTTVHALGDFSHRHAVFVNVSLLDADHKPFEAIVRRLDRSLSPGESVIMDARVNLPPGYVPVTARLYLYQARDSIVSDVKSPASPVAPLTSAGSGQP